ncbi:hypothetical protein [Methylomagnum sp.]
MTFYKSEAYEHGLNSDDGFLSKNIINMLNGYSTEYKIEFLEGRMCRLSYQGYGPTPAALFIGEEARKLGLPREEVYEKVITPHDAQIEPLGVEDWELRTSFNNGYDGDIDI